MTERPPLSRNLISLVGAWLTTISAVAFITYFALESFGLLTSPYSGLIGFILLPAIFVAGLLLIPLGIWREGRRRRHGKDPWQWPAVDFAHSRTRTTIAAIIVLTLVNIGLVTVATVGAVHYMETDKFCGLVCHVPMKPEYTAHMTSAHASVSCVSCHVAPGAAGAARAKMNGSRQAYELLTGTFHRPIASPARNIPAAAETCVRCHTPGHPSSDVIIVKKEYDEDEANTETVTSMAIFTNAAHWHARADVVVEYSATDETRETIPYVRVISAKGVAEYVATGAPKAAPADLRKMDCLDCHNRPAHSMTVSAETALNRAIASGQIPQTIPFIRREALAVLTETHESEASGVDAIQRKLRAFYASQPAVSRPDVDRAVGAVEAIYRTNVFPDMRVTWGVYKSQLAHPEGSGCFRCHDDEHKTSSGASIRQDCELCHKDL